jgi:hypothetical protein
MKGVGWGGGVGGVGGVEGLVCREEPNRSRKQYVWMIVQRIRCGSTMILPSDDVRCPGWEARGMAAGFEGGWHRLDVELPLRRPACH